MTTTIKPSVMFVCVHNAGRSQMAAGFLRSLAGDAIDVRSAGSAPAETINPAAVAAMAELGIDISHALPARLTEEAVAASDVVITMGCGDACPYVPGRRYEDWVLDDPAGQGVEQVRPIRDDIRERVEALVAELLPAKAQNESLDPELRVVASRDGRLLRSNTRRPCVVGREQAPDRRQGIRPSPAGRR